MYYQTNVQNMKILTAWCRQLLRFWNFFCLFKFAQWLMRKEANAFLKRKVLLFLLAFLSELWWINTIFSVYYNYYQWFSALIAYPPAALRRWQCFSLCCLKNILFIKYLNKLKHMLPTEISDLLSILWHVFEHSLNIFMDAVLNATQVIKKCLWI